MMIEGQFGEVPVSGGASIANLETLRMESLAQITQSPNSLGAQRRNAEPPDLI